jgi:hypothetical protein
MVRKNRLWKKKPEAKDYDAARSFLSLLYPEEDVSKLVRAMRKADTVEHVAKDLLRASGLPLLPRTEFHVKDDLKKLQSGEPLALVLLVRGDLSCQRALVIADGYHRICAICHYDEDAPVRCRMVTGPARRSR